MKRIIFLILIMVPVIYPQTGINKSLIQYQNDFSSAGNKGTGIDLTSNFTAERKSPGMAVVLSLLLPGMGELYAGSYESGKYFTIADAVLWGTVAGLNSYASWKRDNYQSYAQTYGGVNPDGKSDDYFAIIGDYNSVEDYNREMNLQREFSQVYDVNKYYWNWGMNSKRVEYRNMWRTSEQAFNSIRFAVGALILNRVISVINAVRLVTEHNRNVERQNSLNVSFSPTYLDNTPVGISLNIRGTF